MEKLADSNNFDIELLKIPIEAVNEPFVPLADAPGSGLILGESLKPEQRYLRETVAGALLAAAQDFKARGYDLELLSAYRSLEWQKQLFLSRVEFYRSMGVAEADLLNQANTYTAGIPVLAAHTAGSAVDVILRTEDGEALDFGTAYRDPGDLSHTLDPGVSEAVRANRSLLAGTMAQHGFANYPFEWWHYSIGDVCWAYVTGQPSAVYLPVEFDPVTGEANDYSDDLRAFFSY